MKKLTLRRPSEPAPDPIADDEYWQALSRWFAPSLTAMGFAKKLGTSEASVRQHLAQTPGFPQPLERGFRNRWSEAQCYDFLAQYQPKPRSDRGEVSSVPRLYHHGVGLAPARFVAGEVVSVEAASGRAHRWPVHLWEPADGRGQIAVAYTASGRESGERWAPRLLGALRKSSAVVVVTDGTCSLPDGSAQPEVIVADRLGRRGGEVSTLWRLGWFDVAHLLRVDLPWWPYTLRSTEAIAAWRPGHECQALRPVNDYYDEQILLGLIDGAVDESAPGARYIAEALNRRIEGRICLSSGPDVPGGVERKGLMQAAFPRFRSTELPDPPIDWEMRTLLCLRVPNRADRHAAMTLLNDRDELLPNIGCTIRSGPGRGPLAQEWVTRLKPIGSDPESLGSMFAEAKLTTEQLGSAQWSWWEDYENPDCWAIRSADDVVDATVGTRIPGIDGRWLVEFELDKNGESAFFRDNKGWVWPMPSMRTVYFNSGYGGTGPQNLVEAVTALRANAGADMRFAAPMTEESPLSDLIFDTSPPPGGLCRRARSTAPALNS